MQFIKDLIVLHEDVNKLNELITTLKELEHEFEDCGNENRREELKDQILKTRERIREMELRVGQSVQR